MIEIPLPTHMLWHDLELEPLGDEHFSALIEILENSKVWEQGFENGVGPKPTTRVEIGKFLDILTQEPDRFFFVIKRLGDIDPIGLTSLGDFNLDTGTCKISKTFVDPQYWGQQVSLRAKALLLNMAFINEWEKVETASAAENTRSLSSILEAGFTLEGVREDANGEVTDVFSITSQNWPTIKARLEKEVGSSLSH
jgi:RimJ/RimL family protein N-acetyltransferase